MSEPDFSGIDPLRVPEARRRIAAIEEYLALAAPTRADTTRIASGVGLSVNQFGRLARVWRDHRDARLLVIGKRGAASRDYGMDPRAVEIAREVIAEAGLDAGATACVRRIAERCADEGVKPPSPRTISNWIREARASAPAQDAGPPRVVLARMWFHLPVDGMPASAMPTLLAAVMLPERIVIAHAISVDPDSPPSVAAVIDAIAGKARQGAEPRPFLLDPDDRRIGADALARAGLADMRSHNRSVQSELSKAFAGRLGALAVVHQRGMARPATKKVLSRQDVALPAEEVVANIAAAIDSNNAAAVMRMPAFSLSNGR